MVHPHVLDSVLKRVEELEGLQARFADEYGKTIDVLRTEIAAEFARLPARGLDLGDVTFQATPAFSVESGSNGPIVASEDTVTAPDDDFEIGDCRTAQLVQSHLAPSRSTQRMSGNHRSVSGIVPPKGFIVNMSRLMTMQEIFRLLHEFAKNTAIAALTLVAGGSVVQVRNTLVFLFFMFLLFDDHERKYDRLDIGDLSILSEFYPAEPSSANPNQVLKALSVSTSLLKRVYGWMLNILTLVVLFLTWQTLSSFYQGGWADIKLQKELEEMGLSRFILSGGADSPTFENDFEAVSMQAIVFTIMYVCCSVFDFLMVYEMRMSAPTRQDGEPWDPRKHGRPKRFVFGMPSMWFTSKSARADLFRWVDALHPFEKVREIYPEELAILAFEGGDAMREKVALSLKEAVYWDAYELETDGTLLDIDFRFFCEEIRSPGMPFPGDYLAVGIKDAGQWGKSTDLGAFAR